MLQKHIFSCLKSTMKSTSCYSKKLLLFHCVLETTMFALHEDYTLCVVHVCAQYAITPHACAVNNWAVIVGLEMMQTQVQGYTHAQSSGDSLATETTKHLKISHLSRLGHHHIHSFQVMSCVTGICVLCSLVCRNSIRRGLFTSQIISFKSHSIKCCIYGLRGLLSFFHLALKGVFCWCGLFCG